MRGSIENAGAEMLSQKDITLTADKNRQYGRKDKRRRRRKADRTEDRKRRGNKRPVKI